MTGDAVRFDSVSRIRVDLRDPIDDAVQGFGHPDGRADRIQIRQSASDRKRPRHHAEEDLNI